VSVGRASQNADELISFGDQKPKLRVTTYAKNTIFLVCFQTSFITSVAYTDFLQACHWCMLETKIGIWSKKKLTHMSCSAL